MGWHKADPKSASQTRAAAAAGVQPAQPNRGLWQGASHPGLTPNFYNGPFSPKNTKKMDDADASSLALGLAWLS